MPIRCVSFSTSNTSRYTLRNMDTYRQQKRALNTLSLILLLLFCSAINVYAQKPVNGNGTVIKQVRPLSQFKSISLDFTADLVIVNGETPSFHIEAEENILPHIGTRVRGGTLYISQDKWIEPTKRVLIRVGTPFTTEIETSGYSKLTVENLKGSRLQVNIGVGLAILNGSVSRVLIRTKTGEIDARELQTNYADVAISSHGTVKLGTVDELIADISSRGTVVYSGEPTIKNKSSSDDAALLHSDEYVDPQQNEVEYVAVTLVNNSRKRVHLRVEGPKERNFSYGFSMISDSKRREDWPIGTRLYAENTLLADELLLTIAEEMQGELVEIFTEE